MFSYSSPLASWIEKSSGVAKCLLASALSSSRMTSTANWVDWRIFRSSSRFVLSLSGIKATCPGSPPTAWTRKLLSRSIEPKRRCLIFSSWLATRVASSPLRKLAVSTLQLLPLGKRRVLPEQALDLAPGEEVGMDDLVRIAAEQKMTRPLQRLEDQRQLHGGDVLHFVDDHEVVARRGQCLPLLGDEIEIKEPGLAQPGAILLEQVVDALALVDRKDRLTNAERQIGLAREDATGAGSEDAADLLEDLMAIELAEGLPHPPEPAGEVAPGGFASRRHVDRFDELAIGEENGFLPRMLETVGEIEIAGTLREVTRVGDVEHLAFGVLELFEGQRGLAATGAADDDQRRRLAIDGLLRVVERDRLVEQMDRRALRVQVTHRQRFTNRFVGVDVGNPGLVDRRAAQKTRLVVIVIGDHFQHQRAHLVAVANQRKQQAVGVIELRPVELAVAEIDELLDLRRTKIVPGDGIDDPAVAGLDARGVEVGVFKNLHGRFQLRGGGVRCQTTSEDSTPCRSTAGWSRWRWPGAPRWAHWGSS
jgi:hypothetical protein